MDMTDNPKFILYKRVSTPGQAEHLRAYARTSGLEVLETIEDAGVFGCLCWCGEAVRGKKPGSAPDTTPGFTANSNAIRKGS